jgi:hypothetical protein
MVNASASLRRAPPRFPRARHPLRVVALALALFPASRQPVSAQTVQITPVAGYRFNNDLFELATSQKVDVDGAPTLGGAVNVDLGHDLWFEGMFTHQEAHITAVGVPAGTPAQWRVTVDQFFAGGRQDFTAGRARPFLTGLLGLTLYGVDGDHEARFSVSAGGGVLVPLQRRLGVRLDGRVVTTFADGDVHAFACASGGCLFRLHLDVAWQAEFTAGFVVAF